MEEYVSDELFKLAGEQFPADLDKAGVFGHSMGGHGAITLAFKYPNKYKSLSASPPLFPHPPFAYGVKKLLPDI